MKLQEVHNIYFLGIGGIGMSALARHFHSLGVVAGGYDRSLSPLTASLQAEGISVTDSGQPDQIPDSTQLIIYTPAIPADHPLMRHARERGLPLMKRAEVLGLITRDKPTIAVAGSHGKTTVGWMLAQVFFKAKRPFRALLGGISANHHSNYLAVEGTDECFIVEADEYDRSFLHLQPSLAAITSMDADHLEIYGNSKGLTEAFSHFAQNIRPGGRLILKKGLEPVIQNPGATTTYHLDDPSADVHCQEIEVVSGHYRALFRGLSYTLPVSVGAPGRHNLENALAAAALAQAAGISPAHIAAGLADFRGVKRRFEVCYEHPDMTYIDDYAHHPEEIRACIESVRELYPGKRLSVIFQPHLYSRTRDLAASFASSLSLADELLLLDIYPAREAPIPGVGPDSILQGLRMAQARQVQKEDIPQEIRKLNPGVLLTLGAGDIGLLSKEIVKTLENMHRQ